MEPDRPKINLIVYACARPNLSNAVQLTAINTFMTARHAELRTTARFEDTDAVKRPQLAVALMKMKEPDCHGLIVHSISVLTLNLSHRQTAELLANFVGPQARKLYDLNGRVLDKVILSMRNDAIAEIHRDID
jgi:hypothetical protein